LKVTNWLVLANNCVRGLACSSRELDGREGKNQDLNRSFPTVDPLLDGYLDIHKVRTLTIGKGTTAVSMTDKANGGRLV